MLGLAQRPRSDPSTIEAQAVPAKTSTQRIKEVMDRLCLEKPRDEPEPAED
jgi:hypothetical protein